MNIYSTIIKDITIKYNKRSNINLCKFTYLVNTCEPVKNIICSLNKQGYINIEKIIHILIELYLLYLRFQPLASY